MGKNKKRRRKEILQYSIVGVFTTPIGVEMSFDALFDVKCNVYWGLYGLSIGYAIKYHCDKNSVLLI